jgi:hypothetical protein
MQNKKSRVGGKIWLFDFCEVLARVSGKRQCAKCGLAKSKSLFLFQLFSLKMSAAFQAFCQSFGLRVGF